MRRLATALGLLVVLAGCLGTSGSGPPADADAGPPPTPAGCDPGRPAWVHGVDGRPAPAAPDDGAPARVLPCSFRTGLASFEPTLGVTSTGTVFVAPAQETFSTTAPVGVARSTDGGATWDLVVPDLAGVPAQPTTQDPYLYVDPATDRVFLENLQGVNCAFISWSDDEGATWDHSGTGCVQFDHQTLFGGPAREGPLVDYPTMLYRCAANAGALAGNAFATTCQKSPDGGRTWVLTGEPAFVADPERTGVGGVPGRCEGVPSHGAVSPSGLVLVPKGHCGQPFLAISDDDGLTWRQVQVAGNGMPKSSGTWAHDAGVGGDPSGVLYYFWVAEDRLPYLAHSSDDGATWSPPRMVGPPGLREAMLPSAVVGGDGRVAWSYVGSFDSPGAPFDGDYSLTTWVGMMGYTVDATADAPTVYSAAVHDPSDPLVRGTCGPLRCGAVFDFIDVRVAPDGTPWAPFVDGCTGACVDDPGAPQDGSELVVGRLWGGPSLWGEGQET